MTRAAAIYKPRRFVLNVNAFSISIRVALIALVTALIIGEITPVPMWPPSIFYPYCFLKLAGFVVAGILTPIAFWRFNALNRGLLFAAISAVLVETLQSLVSRGHWYGHAFHWYELAVKLVLILFGFSIGLDVRYERQLKFGPVHVVLHSSHEP